MLTFAKQMPIAPLAVMAREHDTRVWWVIEHHVGVARAGLDFSGVTRSASTRPRLVVARTTCRSSWTSNSAG